MVDGSIFEGYGYNVIHGRCRSIWYGGGVVAGTAFDDTFVDHISTSITESHSLNYVAFDKESPSEGLSYVMSGNDKERTQIAWYKGNLLQNENCSP